MVLAVMASETMASALLADMVVILQLYLQSGTVREFPT